MINIVWRIESNKRKRRYHTMLYRQDWRDGVSYLVYIVATAVSDRLINILQHNNVDSEVRWMAVTKP